MANFDNYNDKNGSVRVALNLVPLLRNIYENAKQAQSILQVYQAGSNPVLTGAMNALHTTTERQEIGQMLTQLNALVTDWELNHPNAING